MMTETVVHLYRTLREVLMACGQRPELEHVFGGFGELLPADSMPNAVPVEAPPVIDQWLESAVKEAPSPWSELAEAVFAATPHLRWKKSYTNLSPSPTLAAFQDHYSFLPVVGPAGWSGGEAPFLNENVLAGFTLQAPHIDYPGHHHEASELYGVVSGEVDWKIGDGAWVRHGPGDAIAHRPHEMHAMVTHDLPLLNWVAWPALPHSHVYMPVLDPPEQHKAPIAYRD